MLHVTDSANVLQLAALGQASLVTEWGRHGVTFIRAGSWTDPALAMVFLDAAAAAGVSVLWSVGLDNLARAMAAVPNTKTNVTGDVATLWGWTEGNIRRVFFWVFVCVTWHRSAR